MALVLTVASAVQAFDELVWEIRNNKRWITEHEIVFNPQLVCMTYGVILNEACGSRADQEVYKDIADDVVEAIMETFREVSYHMGIWRSESTWNEKGDLLWKLIRGRPRKIINQKHYFHLTFKQLAYNFADDLFLNPISVLYLDTHVVVSLIAVCNHIADAFLTQGWESIEQATIFGVMKCFRFYDNPVAVKGNDDFVDSYSHERWGRALRQFLDGYNYYERSRR